MKLTAGDPAPWFTARSPLNPRYVFDTIAGRYIVLCFLRSAGEATSRQVVDAFAPHRAAFDAENAIFFQVSTDPEDERLGRLQEEMPGWRIFWDFDQAVSRLYGATDADAANGIAGPYHRFTLVLDERLRVLKAFPFGNDPQQHAAQVMELVTSLPPMASLMSFAPVLIVPRIFEGDFCRRLIRLHEERGGFDSGFMRDVDGKTVGIIDYDRKRREDCLIEDLGLQQQIQVRISRRLVPEIQKAFQFRVTRLERYLVACYDAAKGGHFLAHRDNTTKGTAHRRLAVTINLNTEEYDGGQLWFPEFGRRAYRPPTGGAIVFSCSLLHEAIPVTRGRRFAFLPFLYDEEGARVRAANLSFISEVTPGS